MRIAFAPLTGTLDIKTQQKMSLRITLLVYSFRACANAMISASLIAPGITLSGLDSHDHDEGPGGQLEVQYIIKMCNHEIEYGPDVTIPTVDGACIHVLPEGQDRTWEMQNRTCQFPCDVGR